MNKPASTHSIISALAFFCWIAASSNSLGFGGPPGGPSGNGNYFPNDGTFSAVVRGVNLAGILQFSSSQDSGPTPSSVDTTTLGIGSSARTSTVETQGLGGVGSTGVSTIYYAGASLLGNSQGFFNPEANTMAVNFQASSPGQGDQTISVQEPVTTSETTNVINPLTGQVTPVQTTQTEFVETRRILYFDSLYINGAADCRTSNAFPVQKFEGNGQATYKFLIFTGKTPIPDQVVFAIAISGVRLSNTAASFNVRPVQVPSVNEFNILIK